MIKNETDLLSKIKELERKTAVVPQLENQLHQMKHREKVYRRQSIFTAPSSKSSKTSNSTSSKETKDEDKENLKELVEKLKLENEEKDEEIRLKNRQFQKILQCFKSELEKKEEKIRMMNDLVVDLKGQIRVAVRVREHESKEFVMISANEVKFQMNNNSSIFNFEHIFAPQLSQIALFDEIKELISCALHGKNVCLIAYGPTGTGKTFTMRGEKDNEGVIPRAIRFMLEQTSDDLAIIGWKYRFSASFVEVYNEEVFDLLNERAKLEVKLTSTTTNVVGLKIVEIQTIDDIGQIMRLADSQRSTASTACNSDSSRSHAIFQVHVEGSKASGETIKCSLNLVDLAGSERVKESKAEGKQFKEAACINQSLSTLKKCIRSQMNKTQHVPFRDSKLTMVLREFLGAGSSKTMFIAHVNPSDVLETKRSLEFTSELRSVTLGKATVQTGQKS